MTRVVYVNGVYTPYCDACVHVEDRGYQFADAVYEVCEVLNGCLVDERRHLLRGPAAHGGGIANQCAQASFGDVDGVVAVLVSKQARRGGGEHLVDQECGHASRP